MKSSAQLFKFNFCKVVLTGNARAISIATCTFNLFSASSNVRNVVLTINDSANGIIVFESDPI